MTRDLPVCTCRVPLIAGTGRTILIDGELVDNVPPVCVRCYVRERDPQPARVGRGAP